MLIDGLNLVEGSVNNNIVFRNLTQSQIAVLQNVDIGEVVYQTDGSKGLYVYHGTTDGWVQADDTDLANFTGTLAAARLADSGATAGTYHSVTVDAKGRVTAGTNPTTISGYGITDAYTKTEVTTAISNATPSFSTLTGKPTTVSGYGITDAATLVNGTVPSSQLPSYVDDVLEYANLAAIQALGTGESGKIYIAADTSLTYRWSGSAFVAVGTAGGSSNASDLTAGTLAVARLPALTGGDVTSTAGSGTLTLGTTGVSAGTYNSVTVDAKGRVTAASNVSSGSTNASDLTSGTLAAARLPAFTGDITTSAGSSATTLATSGVTAGTYNNSATAHNSITVDAKGRITATGAATTITPAWSSITSTPTTLAGYGITDAIPASAKGANSGVATLDSTGKLTTAQIPASLVGAVQYQGIWNASTNSPALASSTGAKGYYYKVSTTGTTAIDGISTWNAGDLIIYNGTTWDKIDGISSEVISVAGKTGAVTLTASDVGLGNVTNVAQLAGTQTLAVTGDATASATALSTGTIALTLANSGATAGTYKSVIVNAKGLVTAGTNPTTLAGYGITDAATLASPALTGTPTAPTATADTNTTQLATTAFVVAQAGSATPAMDGTAAVGTSLRYARQDHVHASDTTRAALAANTFTGNQTAPVFVSNTATGTAPLQISSTTVVPNLNVQVINGVTVTGTPATGNVLTASSSTAAAWAAPSGGGGSGDTAATPSTLVMRTTDGSVYATNFYSSSDSRLKSNVSDLASVLDVSAKIDALAPKSYTFNADEAGREHFGLIAQEAELVLEQIVSTNEEGFKAVNYVELIPLLLAEVQSLRKRVAELEAK